MSKSPTERVKATQAQIDFLMQYMRQNVSLSRPSRQKLLSPQETQEKWEYLALSLNGIEGARKSMQQWQKTWRDIQYSLRRKGLTSELDMSATDEQEVDFECVDETDSLNLLVDDTSNTETQDTSDKTIDTKHMPRFRAKLNNRQLEHLVSYMEKNPEMSKSTTGQSLLVRAQLDSRWNRLTKTLNQLGPPSKPLNKWRQTWRDLRNKLRKNGSKKNKTIEDDNNSGEETERVKAKANVRQLEHMTEHMKRHGGDLLKAVCSPGDMPWRKRMLYETHWTQLAQALNDLGPPSKNVYRWKQTWRELRKRYERNKTIKDISVEELNSSFIEENTTDSVEEDSKPEVNEEGLFNDITEESREEDFEFNPIFVDANPSVGDNEELQQSSKTESMQCLIEFEKESLDLRRRQIALEEKRIELKERKLQNEEAKVQALQRIAAALEQNNVNNFNRFNLT